ncbi:hypothetical protein [Streptomyces sulphureus]|uniref:hypothetical protein n=1 Tax=Streptomyces sulphureus TaxID=47758 RepID=UPI00036435E6|nr:hypothetical protein [Streptomyces sulphureus]
MSGADATPGSEWLGATVGAGPCVALLGLLALGVGALLRRSAGAVATMLGAVLLPMVVSVFMSTEALQPVREKLIEYAPLNGLTSLNRIPTDGSDGTGRPQLGLLAVVTCAVLAGAHALLMKRDA